MEPDSEKTRFRQETLSQKDDVAKVLYPRRGSPKVFLVWLCFTYCPFGDNTLCTRLVRLYEEYLIRWRPVLMKNLETKAAFDKTFTDKEFGEGASKCFTLFPGLWSESQVSAFVNKTFVKVLDYKEQKMRKMWSKIFARERKRCLQVSLRPTSEAQRRNRPEDLY